MTFLILLLLLGAHPRPEGFQRLEFDPGLCKHVKAPQNYTDEVHCKYARVMFHGITMSASAPVMGMAEATGVSKFPHPEGSLYEYHYYPDKCSPIPQSMWWLCKNVWWREFNRK